MVAHATTYDRNALDAAATYAATFSGRMDVYAAWNGDHWQAVREPLTPDKILQAFETSSPLSAYLLDTDSRSHVACLDIDRDDGYELGKAFGRRLSQLGGIGYIERSARGCHFWIPLEWPLPAVLIRRALRALIAEAGLPDDRKIELRPASDRLNDEDSLGHCIRMPTMPHQRTHKRYRLVSNGGEIMSGKLVEMMLDIEPCPVAIFHDAAERAPLPKLTGAPKDLRFPHGPPAETDSVSEILRNLWGVPNAQPGRAVRCPAHDDRHPSLSIAKDDQRVWCKSGSCLLSGDGGERGLGAHQLTKLAKERR
jgi:hypothetical protein